MFVTERSADGITKTVSMVVLRRPEEYVTYPFNRPVRYADPIILQQR